MGNCKGCLKSKTSDDFERQSTGRQSFREQGQGQRSSRASIRSTSSESKSQISSGDPTRASARSIDRTSKGRKSLSGSSGIQTVARASVRSTTSTFRGQGSVLNSNHGTIYAVAEDVPGTKDPETFKVPDLERRSSSRASRKQLNTGQVQNKENIFIVKPPVIDEYEDGGTRLMNQMKQKHRLFRDFNFNDICTILWEEDNHLEFGKHYEFSRKQGLSCHIDESFIAQHPTYDTFRNLLELHSEGADDDEWDMAEDNFIEEVLRTKVMQICWAFLNQSGYISCRRNDFANVLRSIWFPNAFEHIFAGDCDEETKKVNGLHNWLQYSFELEKGNIVYKKCIKQVERMMVVLQYMWNGILKDYGSMFIGTSPEFELALFTLLYFVSRKQNQKENIFYFSFKDRKENTNNVSYQQIQVKIITHGDSLKTAYPLKP